MAGGDHALCDSVLSNQTVLYEVQVYINLTWILVNPVTVAPPSDCIFCCILRNT